MLDSKILLGIIFLICSILSDYQTNALRCYQCIQGSNYFCDEGDMYPVTCPSDAIKCGIAYATKNSVKYEWRGCVNSTEDTNITANLGTFGDQLLSSTINASSYETCAADLCNSPLKCYFCTAGVSNICGINDTGVTNCNLKHSSCAKITFSDDQVWKGCLTSDQVSNYGDQSTLLLKLNSDFGVSNLTASSPTGFYSCSTNMCNAGRIAASLGVVTSLAPLLLSLVLLWINL